MELQVIVWDGAAFRRASHVEYRHDGQGWASREVVDAPMVGEVEPRRGLG
jgi:hypothetical protein